MSYPADVPSLNPDWDTAQDLLDEIFGDNQGSSSTPVYQVPEMTKNPQTQDTTLWNTELSLENVDANST